MKTAKLCLSLMVFSTILTIYYHPELWYWTGLNLLFSIIIYANSLAMRKMAAMIEFQRALLSASKVLFEAQRKIINEARGGTAEAVKKGLWS